MIEQYYLVNPSKLFVAPQLWNCHTLVPCPHKLVSEIFPHTPSHTWILCHRITMLRQCANCSKNMHETEVQMKCTQPHCMLTHRSVPQLIVSFPSEALTARVPFKNVNNISFESAKAVRRNTNAHNFVTRYKAPSMH